MGASAGPVAASDPPSPADVQAPPMPLLFSYGTLQDPSVQLAVFGRTIEGRHDELVGFGLSQIQMNAERGEAHGSYPIVHATGRPTDRVTGTLLDLTEADLLVSDRYESEAYQRVPTVLDSGAEAWVYADPVDPRRL